MTPPDWAARALAAPVTVARTEVDGTTIAWRGWGEPGRPAVVLVHGGGAHSRWWDPIGPVLADAGRHVVAVDLAGHGDSDRRPPYEPAGWADELLGLCSALELDRPTLVGHSMGGFVVLDAAARAGASAVRSVVVVDSPIGPPEPGRRGIMAAKADRPPSRYATRDEALGRFRLIPDQPTPTSWTVEHVAATSVREFDDGWGWAFDPPFLGVFHTGDPRWTDAMEQVAVPVDVVLGEHSFVQEPGLLDHARATLPATTGWHEVAEAWHHLLLDRPAELTALLDRLLAAHGR